MAKPRILLYDIETSPNLGYYWSKPWETNIIKTEKSWHMLSFAYKWLGENKVHVKALCDYPLYEANLENDFFLVKDLHALFDEADILVAHNGDRFDMKRANARFLRYNMKPPSPSKTVDTLTVARTYFNLDSNRLNDVGQYLGIGGKIAHTGFDLWERCMRGDLKAWALMKRYNKRDVVLLEQVYLALRPYMKRHPSLTIYDHAVDKCPNCLGGPLHRRGEMVALSRKYQRFQCQACGHWTKGPLIPNGRQPLVSGAA
jgi:hypothetical protein